MTYDHTKYYFILYTILFTFLWRCAQEVHGSTEYNDISETLAWILFKSTTDIPRNSGYGLNCTAVFAPAKLLDNHTVAEWQSKEVRFMFHRSSNATNEIMRYQHMLKAIMTGSLQQRQGAVNSLPMRLHLACGYIEFCYGYIWWDF